MMCPYCDYEYDFDHDTMEPIDNREGEFFYVSNKIQMERSSESGRGKDTYSLTGCPKCKKVFMS